MYNCSNHALEVVTVELGSPSGIEEVGEVPVPAYLTAGDSCANPTEGGLYRYTLYTFFCNGRGSYQ